MVGREKGVGLSLRKDEELASPFIMLAESSSSHGNGVAFADEEKSQGIPQDEELYGLPDDVGVGGE
jgi:hypothetical protein